MRSLPLPLPPRRCAGANPCPAAVAVEAACSGGSRGTRCQFSVERPGWLRVVGWAFQGLPLTTDMALVRLPRRQGVAQRARRIRPPRAPLRPPRSAAQAEAFDERPVAGDIVVLEVAEQPAAAADHLQQAAARVVVVLVNLEMLGELVDARGQQGHLDLGRAGVAFLGRVLGDDLGLVVLDQHAATSPMTLRILPGGPGWRWNGAARGPASRAVAGPNGPATRARVARPGGWAPEPAAQEASAPARVASAASSASAAAVTAAARPASRASTSASPPGNWGRQRSRRAHRAAAAAAASALAASPRSTSSWSRTVRRRASANGSRPAGMATSASSCQRVAASR